VQNGFTMMQIKLYDCVYIMESDDGITVVAIVWKFKLLRIKRNLPHLIPFNIVLLRNVRVGGI